MGFRRSRRITVLLKQLVTLKVKVGKNHSESPSGWHETAHDGLAKILQPKHVRYPSLTPLV